MADSLPRPLGSLEPLPPRESSIPGVPEGAWRCSPCDDTHYFGDICWYWDVDPEVTWRAS